VRPAVAQKFNPDGTAHGQWSWFAIADSKERGGRKGPGGDWFADGRQGQDACAEAVKVAGISFNGGHAPGFNVTAAQRYRAERDAPDSWAERDGVKCTGQKHGTEYAMTRGPVGDGVKIGGSGDAYWRKPLEAKRREATAVKNGGDGTKVGGAWFGSGNDMSTMRQHNSKSDSRKVASAMIAEIPFPLAQHIARVFKPC